MLTGIFGGSFNPIHTGHISLARELLQQLRLDEIWFVVSPLNPFKAEVTDLLDDDIRLMMARKALEGDPHLMASDYEFHLPKPSYTWNTLQHLSTDYPDRRFVLIIGADNWQKFDRWAHHDYILAHYPIAVYPREGYPVSQADLPAGVTLVDTPLYRLSSTEIRQRIAHHQDITGLVPQQIEALVQKLYSK